MSSNHSERLKKLFTGGMGKVYTSPVKQCVKAKTSTIANHLGQYKKIEALEKKLALLQNPSPPCKQDVLTEEVSIDAHIPELVPDDDEPMDLDQVPDTHPPPLTPSLPLPRKSCGLLPGDNAHKLFDQWKVLPQLVQSLLSYSACHHFAAPDLAVNQQNLTFCNYIFSSKAIDIKTLGNGLDRS